MKQFEFPVSCRSSAPISITQQIPLYKLEERAPFKRGLRTGNSETIRIRWDDKRTSFLRVCGSWKARTGGDLTVGLIECAIRTFPWAIIREGVVPRHPSQSIAAMFPWMQIL
jgi:hypothetical protein